MLNTNLLSPYMDGKESIMASNGQYNVIFLERKLSKWIENDDPRKVADYYVRYCDTTPDEEDFSPLFVGNVPPIAEELKSFHYFREATAYLKSRGYIPKIGDIRGKRRLIVILPSGKILYSDMNK